MLNSTQEELPASEDVKVLQAAATRVPGQRTTATDRVCPLYKQAGHRKYQHYLSKCTYLRENDHQCCQVNEHAAKSANEDERHDAVHPTVHSISQLPYIDAFLPQTHC